MTKLKRSHDKESPYVKPRTVHSYLDGAAGIALSASQVYRAQTLLQKHDPLWDCRRLSYSRQKYNVCRLVFCGSFPGFGVV